MKRIPFVKSAIIFWMLVFLPATVGAQGFTIEKYEADIRIHKDSSFVVKETITVDFLKPKHGIYRAIPYKYRDELGKTMKTPIEVLAVTDGSGKKRKYRVSRRSRVINIRIGDPDRYVKGEQTYVIEYKVQNAILFFDDHDELYWNVTGNYWKAPIDKVSARVELITGKTSTHNSVACTTGVIGSRESACTSKLNGKVAEFATTRSLKSGEGFTISYGWDKGLVTPPSAWDKLLWELNLKQNWVFVFPFLAIAYMAIVWLKRGRDPRVREAVAVMYGPPKHSNKELSPAEVGTLVDERLDARDTTSAIVGLAVKGYIKIEERAKEGWIFDSTDYVLKKIKDPDANLTSFEKMLMRKVFLGSPNEVLVSSLKNKFYKNLDDLKRTLFKQLMDKGYFVENPERVRNKYARMGAGLSFVLAVVFAFLSSSFITGIIAGILTGAPFIILARFMPAKTNAGALAYSNILGFQEFLSRAEKDRLERMGDANLFSKFLPYAIALGVENNWAEAFEGIYQEAPTWYISPHPFGVRTFSPHRFSNSLNSMTSTLGSAMFTAPRSSGSSGGGGGFSGGGFGGGGGGSW